MIALAAFCRDARIPAFTGTTNPLSLPSSMTDLSALRTKIDAIDDQMLKLIRS
jgi:hypothetical protein